MILGIVGSRKRNSLADKRLIESEIRRLNPSELVSGGCSLGADRFAEELSHEMSIPIKVFRPKLGPKMTYVQAVKAYYERNGRIAEYCDVLVAAVSPERRGGTEDTIRKAKKLGKNVKII